MIQYNHNQGIFLYDQNVLFDKIRVCKRPFKRVFLEMFRVKVLYFFFGGYFRIIIVTYCYKTDNVCRYKFCLSQTKITVTLYTTNKPYASTLFPE